MSTRHGGKQELVMSETYMLDALVGSVVPSPWIWSVSFATISSLALDIAVL